MMMMMMGDCRQMGIGQLNHFGITIKLASVEFYVRILVEFLLARFTLFVRTSENY